MEFEYTLIYDSLPNTGPIDFFKEIQKSVFFLKMNVFKTVGNLLKPYIVGKVLEKIHGRQTRSLINTIQNFYSYQRPFTQSYSEK